MPPTRRIEINFPVDIEFPPGWEQALDALVDMVCQQYNEDNPTRTMWPAGHGAKILWNEPHEPDHDNTVYCIDVAEKQASERDMRRRLQQKQMMQQGRVTNLCAMGRHKACQRSIEQGQLKPEAVCECPCHKAEKPVNEPEGADLGGGFHSDPEKGKGKVAH